jgi:hypothetical protein
MKPRTDNLLSPADLERIDSMKQTPWVAYDRAISIRQEMDSLVRQPRVSRPSNLVLVGDSNNGKSTILRNFCKRHYPENQLNSATTKLPVVMVQTPPNANEGRLYYEILSSLGAAASPNESDTSKLSRIKLIFENLDTKVLILDDLYNIGSSSIALRRRFLNALRNLGNESKVSIIGAGTPEILNIFASDPSIQNRFKPIFLPRWNKEQSLIEFARIMSSLKESLRLKNQQSFTGKEFFERLLIFSEGLLGEAIALLHLLAENAIRTGKECIETEDITRDHLKKLNWVSPKDRSRHTGDLY